MTGLDLIIFDMDGLMFDTERVAFAAWSEAASGFGYTIDEGLFIKTLGLNEENTRAFYQGHFGESFPVERVQEERFLIGERMINQGGVPLKDGLLELLDFIEGKNIKKAVATSTSRERAVGLLELARVNDRFDRVLCGDEIERSKPEPEMFLKAASRLGCPPGRCLVLEDSETGILAAHRAGMKSIMVPDMKEPSEEIKQMCFKQITNLREVRIYLEHYFKSFLPQVDQLRKMYAEFLELPFPEQPEDDFLGDLFTDEFILIDLHVAGIVSSFLNGTRVDKKLIYIDEEFNKNLNSFKPKNLNDERDLSSIKDRKKRLDRMVSLVLRLYDQ